MWTSHMKLIYQPFKPCILYFYHIYQLIWLYFWMLWIDMVLYRLQSSNHWMNRTGQKNLQLVVWLKEKFKRLRILELLSALRSTMMFLDLLHSMDVSSIILFLLSDWFWWKTACNYCYIICAVSGSMVERGSTIQAAVLDVSKTERLVDLSLKAELVDKWKGENSSRQTNRKVKPNIQF